VPLISSIMFVTRIKIGRIVTTLQATSTLKRREAITAYTFLLPTMVGFLIFVLGPMLAAIGLSFFDWNLLSPPKFVGLENYATLISDRRLGIIYLATSKIAVVVIVVNILLGLAIAVLLDRKMPAFLRQFFRLSYFFPIVISASAVALIWSFLMNKDLGLINFYLGKLGIDKIPWLNSSAWSPISIAITTIWHDLGFNVLVFLGGLQSIPHDYYEAAEVDGANSWTRFTRITLPLLSPTTFFLTVINLVNALQIFAQSYVLTRGGPGDSSRTVVMYLYEQGFHFFSMGYASTVALSLFVVIAILTFIQFRLSRRWVFYE